MFNAAQVKALQQDSVKWLSFPEGEITSENVEELRNILRFHEHRYYVENDPLITDGEYDAIFKKLEKFEKANPSLITADSPTQRVGAGLIKNFPKVQHLVPMLSLDNSYNADDLIDFDRKVRELSGIENVEYCIEPKFDGASISLVYENIIAWYNKRRW
jgi:DNA ligase (NAD+)